MRTMSLTPKYDLNNIIPWIQGQLTVCAKQTISCLFFIEKVFVKNLK